MHKAAPLLLILTLALPAIAADPKFDPDARAKAIAPFLDDQAMVVVHVDVTRIDVDQVADKLAERGKDAAKELLELRQASRKWIADFTGAGGRELYFVLSLADVFEAPFFAIVPLEGGADAKSIMMLLSNLGGPEQGRREKLGPVVFAGGQTALERLRTLQATPRLELAKAFAAAGDTVAQGLLLPTAATRRVLEETLPMLPKEVGGQPVRVLTRGILWAAAGVDASPHMSLRIVVQSQDAQSAQMFKQFLTTSLNLLGRQKEVRQLAPNFDQLVDVFTPTVDGDRLKLVVNEKDLSSAIQSFVLGARRTAREMTCFNNLKVIGVAFHSYHDVNKSFPAVASFDMQGKPLLSWRVHILPYIGEDDLYKAFHLDEPWDSEHNKKLISRMPKLFRCPSSLAGAGKTTYLAPVGEATMFTGGPKGVRVAEVTDGLSNTILIVDAADDRAVIWTKPEDLKYDPNHPLVGLVGLHEGGFHVLLGDASARRLSETIPKQTLQALFTRNGGEKGQEP